MAAAPERHAFMLLDDIQQIGKADTTGLGFTRMRAIPTAELWARGSNRAFPDIMTAAQAAARHINSKGIVCLNIEHWSTSVDNVDDLRDNLNKYIAVARGVKEALPNAQVGFYSMIPIREYYAPVRDNQKALEKWRAKNDLLAPLGEAVDIIFPSLYAFNHDEAAWLQYAIANINEARRFNKPVYAFLWPQVHESSRAHGLQFVSYDFWTLQLETVLEHADGLVIWTKKTPFDEDADWWRATVDFATRHGFSVSTHTAD